MMLTNPPKTVTLALSGASGAPYALKLLQSLLDAEVKVYLLVSSAAQVVLATETELNVPARAKEMQSFFSDLYNADEGQLEVFAKEQWMAPVASGSNPADAMVICPCSMGMVSAVAQGASNTLMERAADVMIKERRPLIIVPRDMPFSSIHLENLLKLSQLGVDVMPANPGFYHEPKSIDDLVNFVVARILDHLKIDHQLMTRWGE